MYRGAIGRSASRKFSWTFAKPDRKSTRLNSSHQIISYAVFCLKKKKHTSELQSQQEISYAVFCLKKKKQEQYKKNPKQTCTAVHLIFLTSKHNRSTIDHQYSLH